MARLQISFMLVALWAFHAMAMVSRPSAKKRKWANRGNHKPGLGPSASTAPQHLNSAQVNAKVAAWIKTKLSWLSLDRIKPALVGETREQTAIVTHAGKNHQEYIDMSIMLGRALTKYVPNVPKVAMIIAGMKPEFQVLLRQAGWKVVKVDDVDPCSDGIQHCDEHFQYRWKDSFEKLNIFRLPFKRVLFLDADTFVFNDGINFLLNTTVVPEGHVAMAPDGCKTNLRTGATEYNSGVMVFQPSLTLFQSMLELVSTRSGDDMLDQNIINEVFADKVVELDKKFDCIDPVGVPPGLKKVCKKKHICRKQEVVISHFTGMFKPTKANPYYLRLVQQPEVFKEVCENTNHGGCQKWAEYYCAMHAQRKHLTHELQEAMNVAGGCCLGQGHNNPECAYATAFNNETDGCPRVIDFSSHDATRTWMSPYYASDKPSTAFHDYRPIYKSVDKELGMYMFYISTKRNWVIGPSPSVDLAVTYAHADALCPHDANHWKILNQDYIWQAASGIRLNAGKGACPTSLRVMEGAGFPDKASRSWIGTFTMSGLIPQGMHGGKPIYEKEQTETGAQPIYMYFLQAKTQWNIGPNYKTYTEGLAFVKGEAFCPKESLHWQIQPNANSNRRVAAQLLILDNSLLKGSQEVPETTATPAAQAQPTPESEAQVPETTAAPAAQAQPAPESAAQVPETTAAPAAQAQPAPESAAQVPETTAAPVVADPFPALKLAGKVPEMVAEAAAADDDAAHQPDGKAAAADDDAAHQPDGKAAAADDDAAHQPDGKGVDLALDDADAAHQPEGAAQEPPSRPELASPPSDPAAY